MSQRPIEACRCRRYIRPIAFNQTIGWNDFRHRQHSRTQAVAQPHCRISSQSTATNDEFDACFCFDLMDQRHGDNYSRGLIEGINTTGQRSRYIAPIEFRMDHQTVIWTIQAWLDGIRWHFRQQVRKRKVITTYWLLLRLGIPWPLRPYISNTTAGWGTSSPDSLLATRMLRR